MMMPPRSQSAHTEMSHVVGRAKCLGQYLIIFKQIPTNYIVQVIYEGVTNCYGKTSLLRHYFGSNVNELAIVVVNCLHTVRDNPKNSGLH